MCAEISITPYITAIGGAIVGGAISLVVGILLTKRTHNNALDLMKRQEASKAAAEFRNAFIDELCALEDSTDGKVDFTRRLIIDAFPKHFRAYITYRTSLSVTESDILTKKWEHYCEVHNEIDASISSNKKTYRFSKYISGDEEQERISRLAAIQDINSLFDLH